PNVVGVRQEIRGVQPPQRSGNDWNRSGWSSSRIVNTETRPTRVVVTRLALRFAPLQCVMVEKQAGSSPIDFNGNRVGNNSRLLLGTSRGTGQIAAERLKAI